MAIAAGFALQKPPLTLLVRMVPAALHDDFYPVKDNRLCLNGHDAHLLLW
jgi:hypothetical protein